MKSEMYGCNDLSLAWLEESELYVGECYVDGLSFYGFVLETV